MSLSLCRTRITIFVLSSLILVMIAGTAWIIFQSERNFLSTHLIKSQGQAQLLGENIAGKFYTVDLTLMSTVSMIRAHLAQTHSTGGIERLSAEIVAFVESRARFLPQIENLIFLGADGRRIYQLKDYQGSLEARWIHHRDTWLDLSIEVEVAANGRPQIFISRRLEGENGRFQGVLLAMIDPVYLTDPFFDYLDMDADRIVLLDADARFLIDWSRHWDFSDQNASDIDILKKPAFQTFSRRLIDRGGLQTLEKDQAIYSAYQLSIFPFRIIVAYDKQRLFTVWYRSVWPQLGIVIVFSLVSTFALLLTILQLKRREKAEKELLAYRDHLEQLVHERTTDLVSMNRTLEDEIQIRKKAEEQIESALREKTTLLREIHHRVKNNMAVIGSLLRLQANRVNDQRLREAFVESQNRIQAMSMIHEILYQADNQNAIEQKDYLSRIARTVLQVYQISKTGIRLEITADKTRLTLKKRPRWD